MAMAMEWVRKAGGKALLVALVGAIVVYHEHIARYIEHFGGMVAGIGSGPTGAPPKIELPTPEQAIAKGRGRGMVYLDKLLGSSELKKAFLGDAPSPSATDAPTAVDKPDKVGSVSPSTSEAEVVRRPKVAPATEGSENEVAPEKPPPRRPASEKATEKGPTPILGGPAKAVTTSDEGPTPL